MARLWRICRQVYDPLSGEGARLAGGRWNREGTPMVYTASTLSLAMLEVMVGFDETEDMPADLSYAELHLPDDLPVREIAASELPDAWNDPDGCPRCQKLGTEWAEEAEEVALVVPSSVQGQGEERNYLLNPQHPDFDEITVAGREPIEWDERLERMIRAARG